MPNRILRDWTDSFALDELDANTERFFVRLIMKVDDYGRFYSDARLLKSNLFPLKTDIRETDISRWITACENSGLITVYNVANKSYLQIQNFKQQLRQKTEKYPSPPTIQEDDTQTISICVADDIPETKRNETETETKDVVDFDGLSFPKTHFDHCAKFTTDKISLETFMQQYRIKSVTALKAHLMDFNKHLNIEGKQYDKTDYKEFKKHFLNWFRITYKPVIPLSNNSKNNFREEYGV